MQNVILASGSPRRKELMDALEVPYEVSPSEFDESLVKCDDPVELVEELALQKALEVAGKVREGIVIGADTVIELNGEILGKPKHRHQAEWMLEQLSGKKHQVITGVAVVNALTGEVEAGSEVSQVSFVKIDATSMSRFLDTNIWLDKAGAYAIQNDPFRFVHDYEGSYTNIVGLPLELAKDLLERMGIVVRVDAKAIDLLMRGERE